MLEEKPQVSPQFFIIAAKPSSEVISPETADLTLPAPCFTAITDAAEASPFLSLHITEISALPPVCAAISEINAANSSGIFSAASSLIVIMPAPAAIAVSIIS